MDINCVKFHQKREQFLQKGYTTKDWKKIGVNLIETLGFYGIANTEFKLDIRTGEFKLIEINARSGMWNSSVLNSGINMPLLALEGLWTN